MNLHLQATKGKHAAACEVLVSHDADLKAVVHGRSVGDLMKENMPYFDAAAVKRAQLPAAKAARYEYPSDFLHVVYENCLPLHCRRKKFDCAARLGRLLDFAERNALKGLSNAHNLLEFKIYLKMMVGELI